MDSLAPESLDALLSSARDGDRDAVDRLFRIAYDDLKGLAGAVRPGRASETINTTALVHEAYAKIASGSGVNAHNLMHFKRIVGRAMRQVLVDAARAREAGKRGGDQVHVTLDTRQAATDGSIPYLDLDAAMDRLEVTDPRAAAVVECRFFSGMDVDETAAVLEISTATVKRDWRMARAWLEVELNR